MVIQREKAIAALLGSSTQAEAAEKLGITARTLRGYLADPDFDAEYRRRKSELVTDATRQIHACYSSAIQTLRNIVESDLCTDGARISAARAILEFGLKFTEASEIVAQLDVLREAAEAQQKGWNNE